MVGKTSGIEFASSAAARLLATYFPSFDRHLLPPPLAAWAHGSRGRPQTPFTVARNGTCLVVDVVGPDGVLVLAEAPTATLTARERDVMHCVAAGKSTAETARLLYVTPATVSKHLEHVYAKLGVRSRTAAVAKLSPVRREVAAGAEVRSAG